MATFVFNQDGQPLTPTYNIRKIRRMLKDGRARIAGHKPFTIQLLCQTTDGVQDIETTEDPGYAHIGLSVKPEKHEYISEERNLLADEKNRHDGLLFVVGSSQESKSCRGSPLPPSCSG